MGIGKNVKALAKDKGLTLVELSGKSGVSINTIYRITKDDPRNVTTRTLDRLAEALEVNMETLRTGKQYAPEKDNRSERICALEKEINVSEAIMKIIKALSMPGEKDWSYIEYLVAEARTLDTETEEK